MAVASAPTEPAFPAGVLGTDEPPTPPALDELEDWLAEWGVLEQVDFAGAQGVLPTPEEAFGEVLAGAEAILATVRSPLDAEMWGSEMLGILALPPLPPAAAEDLVAEAIVPMAETAATPTALAMLIVLGSLGGPRLSGAATAARQRVVEHGVPEPRWAERVGSPTVGPCWVYGDAFGDQESVTTTFSYGRKRHGLCVLIDHDLGGGLKDCYVVARVPMLRRQMFDMASDDPVSFCEEVSAADATGRLREAMDAPECPWLPDQVEDVARTRALLRSRLALMCASV